MKHAAAAIMLLPHRYMCDRLHCNAYCSLFYIT